MLQRFLALRTFALVLGGFSALAIASALVMQYGFGLYPCTLCIYQRIPYIVLIGLCLLLFFFANPRWQRRIAWLCLLALLVEVGIAAYHTGVEQGVFEGTSSCAPSTEGGGTIDDLRAMIETAPITSCTDVAGSFLGLSIAAWNALAALFFAIAQLYVLIRNKGKTA